MRVIQELRTLLEQREHFISVMSHELRTPLNGIIGLSSTLLLDLAGEPLRGRGPAVTHDVAAIRSSGVRLLNLVNDILDASALREGKLAVKLERVEVRRVAEDVLALVRQLAAPGVVILNDIPSDLPAAKADTGRLIQVMYNLIGNACKFTDKASWWWWWWGGGSKGDGAWCLVGRVPWEKGAQEATNLVASSGTCAADSCRHPLPARVGKEGSQR